MNNRFRVAGIGEILWDLLPEGKKLGGAPANFAFHAQVLGADGQVISAIGNDDLGKQILDELNEINLSSSHISVVEDHPTGTVEVRLDKKGIPAYIIHNNVAWDYIPNSIENRGLASGLDAICFGSLAQRSSLSGSSIHNIIGATSERCLKIFDINIRQSYYSKDSIKTSLMLANCLKLNEEEFSLLAEMFSHEGSEEDVLNSFLEKFDLTLIALTKGEKGSILHTRADHSELISPVVNVIDTVGAGDAFTAALCVGLLGKVPLTNIHRKANEIAAYVCTQKGATPKIPIEISEKL